MVIQLTRLRAGHYIFGGFSIRRFITDESTYWTLSYGNEVEVVEDFGKARRLLTERARERYTTIKTGE